MKISRTDKFDNQSVQFDIILLVFPDRFHFSQLSGLDDSFGGNMTKLVPDLKLNFLAVILF